MERLLYHKLLGWKSSSTRKPLLLKGARQVGKSFLLNSFGASEFKNVHHFNFEQDKKLATIFEKDLFPDRILGDLSLVSGKPINIQTDLVIFDEIQECPNALTSLKYFSEDKPELALCAAGSLLGVKLSSKSFPVGKVEFFYLYPMNFEEFLMAEGNAMLLEVFRTALSKNNLSEMAHQKLWTRLKEYFFVGGMPQAVSTYYSLRDNRLEMTKKVRSVQKNLIDSYHKDFAKHAGKVNSVHIVSLFESVPLQLGKNREGSAKRFMFKDTIPGKKSFTQLQRPIDWLEQAGLIVKVKICNRAELPLESFCKQNLFKLYLFDVGLLGCMLDLPAESIFEHDYGMSKGYYAENFVACELSLTGSHGLHSWTERNSEVEFLRVLGSSITPVEVKSGTRTQAKSLTQFLLKYHPKRAIKLSGLAPKKSSVIHNYPLYFAGQIDLDG